jgi:crossover junction endodeoxyribonuclease RusA
MLHLEVVLPGPPVSYQTSDKANLKAWQATVKAEAAKTWTAAPLTGKLKFLLINFHEGDKPPLDDDNMVKPIRDALNKFVYDDDRQIRYSETIQVPIDDPIKIRGASAILLAAYSKGDEFLYVRVEDAPAFIQLPG